MLLEKAQDGLWEAQVKEGPGGDLLFRNIKSIWRESLPPESVSRVLVRETFTQKCLCLLTPWLSPWPLSLRQCPKYRNCVMYTYAFATDLK